MKLLRGMFLAIIALLTLASCSLAPFSPTNSARSLGPGKASAEFGSANSNYFIRSAAGITENLDLGYVMEFSSVFSTSSIFGKYAFINNPTGASLAAEFGYGSADKSSHTFLGFIGSIAFTEFFEVFLNARYNQADTDEADLDIDDSIGNMTVKAQKLNYGLASAGMNVWLNQNMGFSLYGTQAWGDDVVWDDGLALGGSFLLKF